MFNMFRPNTFVIQAPTPLEEFLYSIYMWSHWLHYDMYGQATDSFWFNREKQLSTLWLEWVQVRPRDTNSISAPSSIKLYSFCAVLKLVCFCSWLSFVWFWPHRALVRYGSRLSVCVWIWVSIFWTVKYFLARNIYLQES